MRHYLNSEDLQRITRRMRTLGTDRLALDYSKPKTAKRNPAATIARMPRSAGALGSKTSAHLAVRWAEALYDALSRRLASEPSDANATMLRRAMRRYLAVEGL